MHRKQLKKGGSLCLHITFAVSEANDMIVNKIWGSIDCINAAHDISKAIDVWP